VANEPYARVKIDQLLRDADWRLTDGRNARFEYVLDDGGKADYALFDRQGRALAVLEAKTQRVHRTRDRTIPDLPAGSPRKKGFAAAILVGGWIEN
jgi:type I site-specific restriction endonuclease